MEADDLLCSRNARPQKGLVGRAQWKVNQPPSLNRERASLGELFHGRAVASPLRREGGSTQVPFRARGTPTMKLWSFDARSKGQPGYSHAVKIGDLWVCG